MSNIPHTLATTGGITPTSLYALEQAVIGWAHERNLIEGSTCRKQLAKTCEEFGELAAGLNKGKRALIKDGVGDVLVTLIIANGCAGGTGIFYADDGDCWIDPTPQVSRMDSHQLVLELVKELAYATEYRVDSVWRTGRMLTLIQALTAASAFAGCSLVECLQAAWLEIKDRKGRMIDGVFVKEADLPAMIPELQQDIAQLNIEYPSLIFTANGEIFCVADIVRLEWVADNAGTRRLRMYPTAGTPAFILSQAESQTAYTKWLTFQINRSF